MICAIDSRGNGLDFDPPVYLSFASPADDEDDDHVDVLLEIEFLSMQYRDGIDDYSDQNCPFFPRSVMSRSMWRILIFHPGRQMY